MKKPTPDRAYFAAFLDLRDRPALVVGGGAIGVRKAEALLRAGARVTVVAPELGETLAAWAREGAVSHRARRFEPADLEGVAIAVAATSDAGVNAAVAAQARARGILVNVADAPGLSTFVTPVVVDRLPIQVAVATGGASPVLAGRLREAIEAAVPEGYGAIAALAARYREASLRRYPDPAERARFWRRMFDGPLALPLDDAAMRAAEDALRNALGE